MFNISNKKRIVIKLGTSTLAHKTGKLNIRRMNNLVRVLADLQNSGSELMYLYDDLFDNYGITVAQILLTKTIIETERQKNVENTFDKLISMGVIPIVNENDTVAIDELELEIGENDSLSAIVAKLAKADLLIILSDIDGLYDSDPHKNPEAKLIPVVTEINEHIENIAGGAGTSLGTGGMATKINAAKIANEAGIDMIIMNGNNPDKLYGLFENDETGTIFISH